MENNGFAEAEIKQIKTAFGEMIDSKLIDIKKWQTEKDRIDVENQRALDELLTKMKEQNKGGGHIPGAKKSFNEAFAEQMENTWSDITQFAKTKDHTVKHRMELKTVGTMTLGASLTGDAQLTYNQRQGLIPMPRVNARDIIPATPTATGQYATFRETGGEGNFTRQVEGESKAQLDFDLTEIKLVQGYIAGFVRVSKHILQDLPWLQNTLPRLLLRKFYEKENAEFISKMVTEGTGFGTTVETSDALAIIDILMGRADRNYNNSFVLTSWTELGRILKLLFASGNYQGSGSIVGNANGTVSVAGIPIVPVSWMQSTDRIIVVDNDLVERVVVDDLSVEWSWDDADNFTKNLVTVKLEAREELNIMRTEAISVVDMGNSASS